MLFDQTSMMFELFIFTVVLIALFSTKYFAFLDKSEQGRETNIDGLRAFLALGVVYHHMIIHHNWVYGKGWTIEGYSFNWQLGRLAISLFFMISAYVLIHKNMENIQSFIKFYIYRAFRIVPMAWVSMIICLFTVVLFGKHIQYHGLISNLFDWFDPGIRFVNKKPDINDFQGAAFINAGVLWTLSWEWFFYFSLPILIVLRGKVNHFAISQFINFIAVYFFSRVDSVAGCFILCFALGMMARDLKPFIKIPKIANGLAILLCLFLIFIRDEDPFSITNIILASIIFLCVVVGGDVFGLLKIKGAVRLGEISYSIYLLHGIMWFYMNKMTVRYHLSAIEYGLISVLGIIAVCLVACVTFVFIECKGIAFGRQVYNKYITHP